MALAVSAQLNICCCLQDHVQNVRHALYLSAGEWNFKNNAVERLVISAYTVWKQMSRMVSLLNLDSALRSCGQKTRSVIR